MTLRGPDRDGLLRRCPRAGLRRLPVPGEVLLQGLAGDVGDRRAFPAGLLLRFLAQLGRQPEGHLRGPAPGRGQGWPAPPCLGMDISDGRVHVLLGDSPAGPVADVFGHQVDVRPGRQPVSGLLLGGPQFLRNARA
jgi:hypothetical protein